MTPKAAKGLEGGSAHCLRFPSLKAGFAEGASELPAILILSYPTIASLRMLFASMTKSPNHALQQTAPRVTAAASASTLPPAVQPPRRVPRPAGWLGFAEHNPAR